ncbi:MAG TPA: diacylglycerol kinase family protein [Oligoflexia bacterium]|nr:diacylglycerol kinase family protein [Oligoflexia bacterium]
MKTLTGVIEIVNPRSGNGRAQRLADTSELKKKVYDSILNNTNGNARHKIETDLEGRWLKELVSVAKSQPDALLAVFGGDGTLSLVAQTVLAHALATKLLFIPGGRGNDFTRCLFGREFQEKDFLDWAVQKHWQASPIDLGQCNERVFLNMASIGYGGSVVENVHERNAFWSKSPAVYQVEGALALLAEPEVSVAVDEGDSTKKIYIGPIFGAFVGNGCANGSGLYWVPEARCDDGKLDLFLLRKPGFFSMLKALKEVKLKQKLSCDHQIATAKTFRLQFEKPVALELDGEYCGRHQSFEIKTVARAIEVYRPI